MKDYYSVLGVSHNVSQEVLDAVYKNLVKNQVENIEEIEEAYKILSNATMREEYDESFENNSDDCQRDEADNIIEFEHDETVIDSRKHKPKILLALILIVIVILGVKLLNSESPSANTIWGTFETGDGEFLSIEMIEDYDDGLYTAYISRTEIPWVKEYVIIDLDNKEITYSITEEIISFEFKNRKLLFGSDEKEYKKISDDCNYKNILNKEQMTASDIIGIYQNTDGIATIIISESNSNETVNIGIYDNLGQNIGSTVDIPYEDFFENGEVNITIEGKSFPMYFAHSKAIMCDAFQIYSGGFVKRADENSTVETYSDVKDENLNSTEKTDVKYSIYDGTDFSDGVALVEAVDDNGKIFAALIDTTGKIILKIEDCSEIDEISKISHGIFVYDNTIYSIRGEVLASPQKSGYTSVVKSENENICDINKEGYVIVEKLEESYKGDKTLFGIINSNGEYEVALTESGSWSCEKYECKWENGYASIYEHWYINEDLPDELHDSYYDRTAIVERKTGGEDDKVILWDFYADVFFENAFLGTKGIWNESKERYIYQGISLFDYKGNKIMDLSEYITDYDSSFDIAYYNNENLLLTADNGTGSRYLFLFDKNGTLMFEPIKIEYSDSVGLHNFGFAISNTNKNDYYDFEGNRINFPKAEPAGNLIDGLMLANHNNGKVYLNQKGEIVLKEIYE